MTTKLMFPLLSVTRILLNPTLKETFGSTALNCTKNFTTSSRINNTEFEAQKSKTNILSLMNFKSQADSAPFMHLPFNTLMHLYKVTCNDEKNGHCVNRLYYICDRLKYSPNVANEYIARRTFLYSLSFEWLRTSLDVLLEYKVPSDRILRDLWVLKYHPNTIKSRLSKVKERGVDTLYPWMVRCPEETLDRYIELTCETKNILSDGKTTLAYLAERLNSSPKDIELMCYKTPSLKSIRATKVKSFIDFLLNEGFELSDIASKPRIFSASQRTVQQRLEILRKHDLIDINLNVLCRSRKGFQKYCETLGISCNKNVLAKRFSSAAYAVKKMRHITDEVTARLVHFGYFHSAMTYGILLWGNAADFQTIFVLQKRAVRAIYNLRSRASLRQV